ncbi:MAG: hypothetical protein WCY05_06220 [Candidatus Omnitrophota bacterium]
MIVYTAKPQKILCVFAIKMNPALPKKEKKYNKEGLGKKGRAG